MTTLQEATTYSVLIYCSLMIIGMFVVFIGALVAASKVKKAKRNIEQKMNILTNLPYIGKHIVRAVKNNVK